MPPRLPLGKRYTSVTVVLLTGGLGLLIASLVVDNDWFDNVAIEFGATLLLFAPLLLLTRGVDRRLNSFAQTQDRLERARAQTDESVATLTAAVTETRSEIAAVKKSLTDEVVARLEEKRIADQLLISQVDEAPTLDGVKEALSRARELGLVSNRGPRVELRETDLFVRFVIGETFGTEDGTVYLNLEARDGTGVASCHWARNISGDSQQRGTAVDILVELTEQVQAIGRYPGDVPYQPGAIFTDLRYLLDLAFDRATGSRGVREPLGQVLQMFPPQWALTETALKRVDGPYEIAIRRLREMDWWDHVIHKPWVDEASFGTALDTSRALYEAAHLDIKPPEYVELPPF